MTTFSGDFQEEPRRANGSEPPPRATRKQRRVQDTAEYLSQRETGNRDAVDQFIAEAEGIVEWENLVTFMNAQGWQHVQTWAYPNAEGHPLYEVHRFNYRLMPSKKRFIQRHPVADGKWVTGAGPVRVPYGLPTLRAGTGTINIVEGEKGADFCKGKGLRATCIQGQNWTEDVAAEFENQDVALFLDNDDAGRDNTKRALEWLGKVNATVRVPVLPDLGHRQGLDDWLQTHSVEELTTIIARTKPIQFPGRLVGTDYIPPDEATLPQYDWLYGTHLLRKACSGTVAKGGSGKSTKSIAEALAMASGKPLLGKRVPRPLRVLLVNLEDDRATMDRRILAAMKNYNLTAEDLGGRLFVKAKGEIKVKIASMANNRSVIRNEECIRGLIDFITANSIDVFSIDPFVKTHGVPESANDSISEVIECYEDIAETANCAIHIWHHTRKGNGGPVTIDDARGAGRFVDALRSVNAMEAMSKEEGKKLNITNPGFYFRVFNGKPNFAPPVEQSDWYRFNSIILANRDNVGVVVAWQHPGSADTTLEASTIAAIKEAVGTEPRWRDYVTADMWVGKAVAPTLDLDPETDRPAIKKILKQLIRDHHLNRVPAPDDHREERMFVVAGPGPAATSAAGSQGAAANRYKEQF